MITRRRVAIHEAGHAVASVLLGLGLQSVTIIPDDEALGRVVPLDDGPNEYDEGWDDWLQAVAVSTLAGYEAERRVTTPEEFGTVGGVDDDWYKVGDYVLHLGGPTPSDQWVLINRWPAEARVLLARNWHKVERVADELLLKGRLSGSDVALLCEATDASRRQQSPTEGSSSAGPARAKP